MTAIAGAGVSESLSTMALFAVRRCVLNPLAPGSSPGWPTKDSKQACCSRSRSKPSRHGLEPAGVLGPSGLRIARCSHAAPWTCVHCAVHDFTTPRVQDGPLETAPRFRSAARWRLAVCGACSRTRVRSARSSPPTLHRTTPRNRSAASGHAC